MAGRPKAFDPDEALDHALDLFWRQGYEATSVPALLEAMQIGRQSLYDTFGSKRALFRQALRRYDQMRLKQVRQLLEQPGSPRANIQGLFQLWGSLASEQPFRGCLVHNTVVAFGPEDPEWAALARQHLRALEGLFTAALARARAAGEVPGTLSTQRQARALVTTFQGLLALGKAGAEAAFIQDVVDAALAPLAG